LTDLAPVAEFDHQDAERTILYVTDDSTVADAVAPVSAMLWGPVRALPVLRGSFSGAMRWRKNEVRR